MTTATVEAPARPLPSPPSPSLRNYARLTAGAAYLLLLAGALVTSTGSSLAVPDWPLSFGKAFPPMLGGVLFEHGHRMIAGVVSLLTFGLAFGLRRFEDRRRVRNLGYAAAGAIVCQALLGGLTVLMRLPPPVSIAHACLGQTVFCLLLLIAEAQAPAFRAPALEAGTRGLWKVGALAVAAVYVQLILGALLRHTGAGLTLHAGWAVVALTCVGLVVAKGIAAPSPRLRGPAALLALAVPCQLALGLASYRVRFSADYLPGFHWTSAVTAAHLGVGALILGTCAAWTLRAYRSR